MAAIDRVCGGFIENWWVFVVRGVLAMVFGVIALWHPLAALMAIVLVFGLWALVDGISALALGFGRNRSWQFAVVGLLGIAVAALTFFWPGITALALYAAVAVWAIFRGIAEIVLAVQVRRVIEGEAWLILAGIASVAFGVLLIALPSAGVRALGWLIGIYALAYGIFMCALAARLRRLRAPTPMAPPLEKAPPLPL
jgi:uncharacterized membrane protein HdeD (DUF308 family)